MGPTVFNLKLFLISAFILLASLQYQALKIREKGHRDLTPLPAGIHKYSFGQQFALADFAWIRSIQDFDYCENEIRKGQCRNNGWLYQMLESITLLDPKFKEPYNYGGLALSIIISDIAGASQIFKKGVQQFPTDWVLAYKAAYHALYEEKDNLKAAQMMEAAAKHGAPDWVYSLAGKLYADGGRKELAIHLYDELRQSAAAPPDVLKKLKDRINQASE